MASNQPNSKGNEKQPFIPKSILKKTTSKPPPQPSPQPDPKQERNRQIALHHANLLQQRKDLELKILSSIETLIDSPSPATTDPQNPSRNDAEHALTLMQRFQPSDFDSLVEERNIDNRCGYVLCPRPPRKETSNTLYRIVRGETVEDVKFVKTKDLEKWCSDVCGKYALYLRVQMSETPAWERVGGHGALELYGEKSAYNQQVQNGVDGLTSDLNALALERGDKDTKAFRAKVLEPKLLERETFDLPVRPPNPSTSHSAIDGYIPKASLSRSSRDDEDPDIMDTL